MDASEIAKVAELQVVENRMYQAIERNPLPYGVLDTRMVKYPIGLPNLE